MGLFDFLHQLNLIGYLSSRFVQHSAQVSINDMWSENHLWSLR